MKQSFFFNWAIISEMLRGYAKNDFTDYTVIFSYWIPHGKLWINTEQKQSSWLWNLLQIWVATAAGMCKVHMQSQLKHLTFLKLIFFHLFEWLQIKSIL